MRHETVPRSDRWGQSWTGAERSEHRAPPRPCSGPKCDPCGLHPTITPKRNTHIRTHTHTQYIHTQPNQSRTPDHRREHQSAHEFRLASIGATMPSLAPTTTSPGRSLPRTILHLLVTGVALIQEGLLDLAVRHLRPTTTTTTLNPNKRSEMMAEKGATEPNFRLRPSVMQSSNTCVVAYRNRDLDLSCAPPPTRGGPRVLLPTPRTAVQGTAAFVAQSVTGAVSLEAVIVWKLAAMLGQR